MKNYAKDKTDLHRRLALVLPEYPLISTFNGGTGVYKAVDDQGCVYLVSWLCEEGQTAKRSHRAVMTYNGLVAESDKGGAGWFRPDEGWMLEDV